MGPQGPQGGPGAPRGPSKGPLAWAQGAQGALGPLGALLGGAREGSLHWSSLNSNRPGQADLLTKCLGQTLRLSGQSTESLTKCFLIPLQQRDSNLGWVRGHQWGLSWRDRPPPGTGPPPTGLPPFVSVQHRILSLCNTEIASVQHRNCLCFTESTLFWGKNWPKIKNWPKLVAVPPF